MCRTNDIANEKNTSYIFRYKNAQNVYLLDILASPISLIFIRCLIPQNTTFRSESARSGVSKIDLIQNFRPMTFDLFQVSNWCLRRRSSVAVIHRLLSYSRSQTGKGAFFAPSPVHRGLSSWLYCRDLSEFAGCKPATARRLIAGPKLRLAAWCHAQGRLWHAKTNKQEQALAAKLDFGLRCRACKLAFWYTFLSHQIQLRVPRFIFYLSVTDY